MTPPSDGPWRLRIRNGSPPDAVRIVGREASRAIADRSSYEEFLERVERRLRAAGLWPQVATTH